MCINNSKKYLRSKEVCPNTCSYQNVSCSFDHLGFLDVPLKKERKTFDTTSLYMSLKMRRAIMSENVIIISFPIIRNFEKSV